MSRCSAPSRTRPTTASCSRRVLAGEKRFEDIVTHDRAWYAQNGFDLRAGLRIDAIDRGARDVVAGGRQPLSL